MHESGEKNTSGYILCRWWKERVVCGFDKEYQVGGIYKADLFDRPIKDAKAYTICHGIHSYSLECKFDDLESNTHIYVYSCSQKRFLLNYYRKASSCLVLCSIPKGSIYYLNENGEYVSEYIRIDNIIPIKQSAKKVDSLNYELVKWNNTWQQKKQEK